jgi:ABC-type Fe3+/spermidine/putrescine transport system ATPase subunit
MNTSQSAGHGSAPQLQRQSEQDGPLALQLRDLTVELGSRRVLHGIDLRLPMGQTLALLGPSGCGKTTLLRSIAGLVAARSGQILIGGQDVARLSPQARGIGMMFQSYALFPNLSVRENIAFGPLAQGWTAERAAARTEELLALIELQSHADQHPARLSGGQRQRVAMARALAPQPALLLMDEPFSAIDESFRLPLRRSFRQLQQVLGQSCVIVTHDREEAFELADQVAVMLEGRLARIDTPTGLLRQPGSMPVARFLGAYNIFERVPDGTSGGTVNRLAALGSGPWVAPLVSLVPASANGGDALDEADWIFDAVVVNRYAGLRGAMLELRLPDGGLLQAREGNEALAAGSTARWVQSFRALTRLQTLPESLAQPASTDNP